MKKDITHPAFANLQHSLAWDDVNLEQQQLLNNWSGQSGSWKKLNTRHAFPRGYYRCKGNEKELFVKVLLPEHGKKTLRAEEVVLHVAREVSSVVPALSTKELLIDYNGTCSSIVIYPYLSQCNSSNASTFLLVIDSMFSASKNSMALECAAL